LKAMAASGNRVEIMKLFYIFKGIVQGMNTCKNFGLFFDWFYPEYFTCVTKTMSAFIDDDEIVILIFKFLCEMVNNRCSRLRFDAWNINGLIVFKETSKIVVQYLSAFGCLSKKPIKVDVYKELYKYLDVLMQIYNNCITGNFINYAICEYYNDDTFTQLSSYIFQMVTAVDIT
jgi:exportin-7